VPIVAAGIWALVVFASYRVVERVFLSVAVVFGAYVVSAFVAGPDWGQVGRALISPSIDLAPNALLLMVATVGTTVTPYMFFYLQSSVADKGLGPEELQLERGDAILGGIWTNAIALFIVIVTAVTIFPRGIRIESAEQAALALAPVAAASPRGCSFGVRGISAGGDGHAADHGLRVCESFGWESGLAQVPPGRPHGALYRAGRDRRGRGLIPGLPLIRRHPGRQPQRDPPADHPGLHAAP
jgi:hypothetical protein